MYEGGWNGGDGLPPDVIYYGETYNLLYICIPGMKPNPLVFVWGMSVPNDPDRPVSSVLVCNEMLEEVDVDISFFSPDLKIDPAFPPVIRSSSAKASAVEINRDCKYLYFLYRSAFGDREERSGVAFLFDDPFNLFVNSRFGISISDLRDASRIQATTDAIQFQLRVPRAQVVNADQRASTAQDTNSTYPSETWPGNSPILFPTTARDEQGRQRVFQDANSTRILHVLLSIILVLSMIGWVLMPHAAKLLSHSATSVAEALTMLARGNI
ncbi:hypothetical protein F4782DRAFT_337986 [Xylaria castorea]|nr:hypothetical protein F4782DRAFT_337986 [Xylaria castorea]